VAAREAIAFWAGPLPAFYPTILEERSGILICLFFHSNKIGIAGYIQDIPQRIHLPVEDEMN
jgi:hypothetical protein